MLALYSLFQEHQLNYLNRQICFSLPDLRGPSEFGARLILTK
jgi:hypothetical protein